MLPAISEKVEILHNKDPPLNFACSESGVAPLDLGSFFFQKDLQMRLHLSSLLPRLLLRHPVSRGHFCPPKKFIFWKAYFELKFEINFFSADFHAASNSWILTRLFDVAFLLPFSTHYVNASDPLLKKQKILLSARTGIFIICQNWRLETSTSLFLRAFLVAISRILVELVLKMRKKKEDVCYNPLKSLKG